MEEEQNIIDNKKLYDDCYYPIEHYIEHKQLINKTDLFDAFSTDIIARYIHYRSNPNPNPNPNPNLGPNPSPNPPVSTELRIGYILYMEADTNINIKNKMNKLLNYMVQLKNPNIYVKSHWVIDETRTNAGLVPINKIKVKVIVLENNKDYAIKMLINEFLYNIKKKDKKYNKYLEKIDTSLQKK
jgi:hypothetical protein